MLKVTLTQRRSWNAANTTLLTGILAFGLVSSVAAHAAPVGNNSTVTPEYFGLLSQYKAPFPTVPFRSWRTDLAWKLVQPDHDRWDFARSDWFVDQAQKHNVEVLFILGYIPRWASSTPDKPCGVGAGQCAEPRDLKEWRNYLTTVAEHYKGKVHYYELWNEPNLAQYYSGSVPGMVRMAQVASEALKEVDPSIQLISPSPTGVGGGVRWLDSFLRAGGGKYVDIIGYHFYVHPGPPEGVLRYVQQVRSVMASNGVGDKPLWSTEIGWGGVSLGDFWQAAYVARAEVLLRAGGVDRSFWYAWGVQNQSVRLAKEDGTTPSEAGKAFQVLQDWMIGGVLNSCTSANIPEPKMSSHGLWTCELHKDGKLDRIIWSAGVNSPFDIPAGWKVKQIGDLQGHYKPVPETRHIEVGEQPILLTAE